MDDAAFDETALARAAGAVLAAIRQADAFANGGRQDRFVALDLEAAAGRLHRDVETHVDRSLVN
jgi:hypothetical protein